MSVTYFDLFGPAESPAPAPHALIEWGDHLCLHHPEIDAQHKAIFDLGNRIYEGWRSGANLDALGVAVGKLAGLLEAHFAYEERLLAELGYDGLEEHAAEHRNMLRELDKMQASFAKPGGFPGEPTRLPGVPGWPVMKLILGFTIAHVMTSDRHYRDALLAGGSF